MVFDLNCSFSLTANPNGPWQVGFTRAGSLDPADFVASTHADPSDVVGLWHPDDRTYYPYVAWNSSALARVDATNSWAVRPHEVAMEGAASGQLAVVRFVAPEAGHYFIQATFEGIHFRHSTTDVHVWLGARPLFDGIVDGYGGFAAFHSQADPTGTQIFTGEIAVLGGDILSFAVGPNGANFNDTTGLGLRLEVRP